jgi:GNAT superfamily N-acetyltransferase
MLHSIRDRPSAPDPPPSMHESSSLDTRRNPATESAATIVAANIDDIVCIQHLAGAIWRSHYPGIISNAQIDYMLERGYSRDALLPFLARDASGRTRVERGIALARIGGIAVGFVAWCPSDTPASLKIDKLYVLPERHRHGIGRALIDYVTRCARAVSCTALTLNVNRNNASSIHAYERCGFALTGRGDFLIGGGFVMEDFIMTRKL